MSPRSIISIPHFRDAELRDVVGRRGRGRPGIATLEGGDVMPLADGDRADRHGRAHHAASRVDACRAPVRARERPNASSPRSCRVTGPSCISTPSSPSAIAIWSPSIRQSSTASALFRCVRVLGRSGVEITPEDKPFLEVVQEALGLDRLRVIATGGNSYEAEREQWDDGNNLLAVEPGRRHRLRPQRLHQHAASPRRGRSHHDRGIRTRPRPWRQPLHVLSHRARSHLRPKGRGLMPINLRGRSVLTLDDFSPAEIRFLLQLCRRAQGGEERRH